MGLLNRAQMQGASPPMPMQRMQPNPMFAPQFLQSPWSQQQGYQPQVTSSSMQGGGGGGDMMNIMRMFGLGG